MTLHNTDVRAPPMIEHPDFGPGDELDVVLLSSDGVKFWTSSYVLKSTSSVFRTTLSLPQPRPPDEGARQKEIQLSEDAQAIHGILRMISGMELPALDTFEEIEKILGAAHKWEMAGPVSIIRRITIPPALSADPLRFYVMACVYGWEEGAKVASALTNNIDIREASLRPMLTRLALDDFLKLQDLRLRRRDGILGILQSSDLKLCQHNSSLYQHPSSTSLDVRREMLKLKAFMAMDNCPSEESLSEAIRSEVLQITGSLTCNSCSQHRGDCWLQILQKFRTLPQTI